MDISQSKDCPGSDDISMLEDVLDNWEEVCK
jgi:hypothetical protein